MSNTSGKIQKNDTHTPPSNGSGKPSQRWSFIQSDLTEALNTWNELEKAEQRLSPEDEQLLKIKLIITQLKQKLEQF